MMGWVPTAALLAVGVIALALLSVAAVGALRGTRVAARLLTTSLAGRIRRIRAGLADIAAWRAARRSASSPGDGA
jgi:hypothetical protein